MRVLIYGGSFDPVHNGHLQVAEEASKDYDEVWFTPCFVSLYGKVLTPFHIRVEMLFAAIKDKNPKFRVSVAEQYYHSITEGQTFKLMETLRRRNKSINEFSFLMGADSIMNIEAWVNWQLLVYLYEIVVVENAGRRFGKKPNWWDDRKHRLIPVDIHNQVSSTRARSLMCSGMECSFIPDEVDKIIKERGLYAEDLWRYRNRF